MGNSLLCRANFRKNQLYSVSIVALAAEAVFGWGCKHFPSASRQHGPPGANAPTPFYYAVFTDGGVFLSRVRAHHNSQFVLTVQTRLQKISKRSPLYPTVLLPEVFKGNIGQEIVTHPEELRRNRRRRNTHTVVDLLFQHRFHLQTSPLG